MITSKSYFDDWYRIDFEYEDDNAHCDFKIIECTGKTEGKEWLGENLLVKGFVKWDGCSHYYFGEEEEKPDGYLHLCGKEYIEQLGHLLLEAHKGCGEIMLAHGHGDISEFDYQLKNLEEG